MEQVRKTFFNPLATSKAQIRDILERLPTGSAHPFSPERILLCRTDNGVDEIDISSYPEDYFFNAVDLGEMGETLLRRMAGFKEHLSIFDDFQIQQAPASTFKIPIASGQITILAVSERTPTYYDFCFADADCNACCWLARDTFSGISHSGDILNGNDLLDYVRIAGPSLTQKEICVFISGYQSTHITRFLGTNPALLVANHVDKVLYIIPVPLDAATIGDATICCPLVIKRDNDSLICSILSSATTDRDMMCHSNTLVSPCFPEAIRRADFTISAPQPKALTDTVPRTVLAQNDTGANPELLRKVTAKHNAVLATDSVALPSFVDVEKTQMIKFSTGVEFKLADDALSAESDTSAVVLPCIFGSQLEGPVLLATGTVPRNVPFLTESALRDYYEQLENVIVVVNDRMTDNARNLATSWKINALFIVQLTPENEPMTTEEVLEMLNSANINAVTALAGPQSLVVVQISDKYYFYRGIANRAHLNTSGLVFGSDVTSVIESMGMESSLIDPRAKRVVNLDDANTIILPASGQLVKPQDLQMLLGNLSVNEIRNLEEDISAAVPQLQMLLNHKDLQELSKVMVSALSTKISNVTGPLRSAYIKFLTQEHKSTDPESVKTKNRLLGELKKTTMEMQKALEPAISSLANLISAQTTSKRTHDLKRLVRQTQIQGNVEAVKSLSFDDLAKYLEDYAAEMGVMVVNIETAPFQELLGNINIKTTAIDARPVCDLDSRVLHLEGFDAGIIIEQSQSQHNGPLRSQAGSSHPTLAMPYLSQQRGYNGSMLAWVCWDEFVNLESPYTVRWMEKCNEAHIAALRILTRDTLSRAVASREHNLQPGSPETGQLMSALLMAAMSKLAGMRTTAPTVITDKSSTELDTVTRLMRGLFGNLLTIAGSGVRPLSMVWQLFGQNPQLDIPTTDADWAWYQTVVDLYPYTGWPIEQFHENLGNLLDKAIVRVVVKAEDLGAVKTSRTDEIIRFCKLRNIQLDHSRTIITAFMRMLTEKNAYDVPAVAARLLELLPKQVERQTNSYPRMIRYLEHLAKGGPRRVHDDLVAASVYTKRSATFGELKNKAAEACQSADWAKVKEYSRALVEKHAETAALWSVKPESLIMQNTKVYKALIDADLESVDVSQETRSKNLELTRQVLSDAERRRLPWQVGKEGQFEAGANIEPLDEGLLYEILKGEKKPADEMHNTGAAATMEEASADVIVKQKAPEDEIMQFQGSLQKDFVTTMQKQLSAGDVCRIIKVPVSAMRSFAKALNPDFVWEDLGANFKAVILVLLKERSNRLESHPVKKLLGLEGKKKTLLIAEY
ncbi:hypothetical protein B0H66DRAFT_516192 [Apodospora peruviana]|uniref:Uncharacterized protein n=1 Tax=Apodospora peruviana TaxID=516989 RepID=A0AAE0I3T5_9PEZI|nr:hypothetical protein B0H66DRAFT_516192 [Apodospora peruviana]